MTEDSGIDKQKLLDEIVGGSGSPPPSSEGEPEAATPEPPAALAPTGPAGEPPPETAAPPPVDAPEPSAPRASVLRHRLEYAALVLVFVGVVWLGVGVAVMRLMPFALGAGFLAVGIALQMRESRS